MKPYLINYVKQKKFQYCIVEHIWRLLRAVFLLTGTGLWLYTDVSAHFIFVSFLMAVIVDQLHGKICHWIEQLLQYPQQHEDWE